MTESTRARQIGGESGHRSFFGGTQPRERVIALGILFVAMLVLTPQVGATGLIVPAALAVIVLLVTQRTARGSIAERVTRRARWRGRQRKGTHRFVPFDPVEWARLEDAAVGRRGAAATRDREAMRAMPDGADGMGWLQCAPREVGIAWHSPAGEQPYLSVAFQVQGQLRGMESARVMGRAADAWSAFLASRASSTNLVGRVQSTTRIMPADSALQEFWVASALDPSAPADAVRSYDEVLRLTGSSAMVQRHFVTVCWPITAAFADAARRQGEGRDGWRALMQIEIDATLRGLADARVGEVEALSARKVAAVLLHAQNPSRPLDDLATVNPKSFGLASEDELSAHVVTATSADGTTVEWWHRTAAIRSENLAHGARSQLWLLELLVSGSLGSTRAVSFHLELVPKQRAGAAARTDLVRDESELRADLERGRLQGDVATMHRSAAAVRASDLAAGNTHHGVSWVGYVTVSERSRDALQTACRTLDDVCTTELGIDRLDWLDSYQSAASGTTWPIGRGLRPDRISLTHRFANRLAGRTDQEALA